MDKQKQDIQYEIPDVFVQNNMPMQDNLAGVASTDNGKEKSIVAEVDFQFYLP